MTEIMPRGSYLYGVAGELDPARLRGLRGVAGSPVRVVPHGVLSALVSTVDLADYGEEGLRRNLEDLGWLAVTARAHDTVLAAVLPAGSVVPVRLATVYHSDDAVRGVLAECGARFHTALRRLQGRTEWGLKAYLDPARTLVPAESVADRDAGSQAGGSGRPGTAYLRHRRARRQDSEALRRAAAQRAEQIHRAVSAVAEAARCHPPQDRRLSADAREMVLNAAYLLPGTDSAPLKAALRQAGNGLLQLEWSGPWVPYSFAELESDP